MKDPASLAERETEHQADPARTFAQALAPLVSRIPNELAAIRPNRGHPQCLALAEQAMASMLAGIDITGPFFRLDAEHHLVEAGLSGDLLAIACGIVETIHDLSYVARSCDQSVHHAVRAEAARWRNVARQARLAACSTVDRPHVPRTAHRAGRSKIHGAAHRASARSGDSGSDDPDGNSDDDPAGSTPPNDGRRFCVCGCGADISHKRADARFYDATHRQRKHRHPDTPGEPDDPYLTLRPWERDALGRRAADGCRCNGHHILDAEDGTCFKCGHTRDWRRWSATADVRLIQAQSVELEHPRPLEQVAV